MTRQAKAWLDSAHDDLLVIGEIFDREDLTHMVAFHSQQAIEKAFKAILAEKEGMIPRVHDLITLRSAAEPYLKLPTDPTLLKQMNELYLDARYPTDLGLLPGGKPPKDVSQRMYHLAQEVHQAVTKALV